MGTALRALSYNEAHCKMAQHYGAGNGIITFYCRLKGRLDPQVFTTAVAQVVADNPILAAVFTDTAGLDFHRVCANIKLPITLITSDGSDGEQYPGAEQWRTVFDQQVNQPMSYQGDYLWRLMLLPNIAGDENCHDLVASFHHSIFDGRSLYFFIEQLFACYGQSKVSRVSDSRLPLVLESQLNQTMSGKRYFFNQMRYWFKTLSIKKTKLLWQQKSPLEKRKTNTVFYDLRDIDQLIGACRQNQASLGALITGALLKAVNQYLGSTGISVPSGLKVITPFDLRSAVGSTHSAQNMGNFISTVHTFSRVTEQADIWHLARQYKADLKTGMQQRCINLTGPDPQKTTAGYHQRTDHGGDYFNAGLGITNLGGVDIKQTSFEIEDLKLSSNRQAGNFLITLHIMSLDNTLYLSFAYTSPLLAEKSAQQIAQNTVLELNKVRV